MFCVMLYFYAQNLIGGGDVKMLTVGFLWVDFLCAFPLAARLAVFAAVLVVAEKLAPQSEPRSVETEVIRSQMGRHLWKWRSPRAHGCEYQLDPELTCPASAEPETT
jgi:Flp pilus assembly protein protease CpaA